MIRRFVLGKQCGVANVEVWSIWPYQWPLSAIQHKCKFSKWKIGGSMLTELACERLGECNNQLWRECVLVPAAMHWKRRMQRGFNQAQLQGKVVAKKVGIPYADNWLLRTRETPTQVGLNRTQRMRNLRRTFHAKKAVIGKKILLFDDVVTTGATMQAMTEVLYATGAKQVTGLSLLRVDL